MPTAVNEQVMDSVTAVNTKNVGEDPALSISQMRSQAQFFTSHQQQQLLFNADLAQKNALAKQREMDVLGSVMVAAVGKGLIEMDPSEAISTVKALTGNDLGQSAMALLASLGVGQIGSKIANTTPPTTGSVERPN